MGVTGTPSFHSFTFDADTELRGALFVGGLVLYVAVLSAVAYLASNVHEVPGELEVSLWLQSWRASWLDSLMYSISAPGFWKPATPIVAATLAFLFLTIRNLWVNSEGFPLEWYILLGGMGVGLLLWFVGAKPIARVSDV